MDELEHCAIQSPKQNVFIQGASRHVHRDALVGTIPGRLKMQVSVLELQATGPGSHVKAALNLEDAANNRRSSYGLCCQSAQRLLSCGFSERKCAFVVSLE